MMNTNDFEVVGVTQSDLDGLMGQIEGLWAEALASAQRHQDQLDAKDRNHQAAITDVRVRFSTELSDEKAAHTATNAPLTNIQAAHENRKLELANKDRAHRVAAELERGPILLAASNA